MCNEFRIYDQLHQSHQADREGGPNDVPARPYRQHFYLGQLLGEDLPSGITSRGELHQTASLTVSLQGRIDADAKSRRALHNDMPQALLPHVATLVTLRNTCMHLLRPLSLSAVSGVEGWSEACARHRDVLSGWQDSLALRHCMCEDEPGERSLVRPGLSMRGADEVLLAS